MARLGTIGIDIGGTKIMFGLFDEKFRAIAEIKIKTQSNKGE
jgi:predicted NBD/HSP70 family sugar kinase